LGGWIGSRAELSACSRQFVALWQQIWSMKNDWECRMCAICMHGGVGAWVLQAGDGVHSFRLKRSSPRSGVCILDFCEGEARVCRPSCTTEAEGAATEGLIKSRYVIVGAAAYSAFL
jgi:hypothetical protein